MQQPTVHCPFSSPAYDPNIALGSFESGLFSRSQWWKKDMSESRKRMRLTGFWCGLTSLSASETAYSVGEQAETPASVQVFCVADGAGFKLRQINETLWDNLPTLRGITDGAYEGVRWVRAETVAPWTLSGMAPRFVNHRAGYSYPWIFPCPQSQLAYLITHLRGLSRLREIFDS